MHFLIQFIRRFCWHKQTYTFNISRSVRILYTCKSCIVYLKLLTLTGVVDWQKSFVPPYSIYSALVCVCIITSGRFDYKWAMYARWMILIYKCDLCHHIRVCWVWVWPWPLLGVPIYTKRPSEYTSSSILSRQ